MTTPPRIRPLTLGEVRVRPKNIAGTGTPMLWWTLTSRTWAPWMPVYGFLVEHERGTLLFDTGQSATSLADPDYYPGGLVGLVFRRQAEFRVSAEQSLPAQLAAAGTSVDKIDAVAISHLHQDHAGNVAELAGKKILVSADELALLEEKAPEMHGVLAEHIKVDGVDFTPVVFEPNDEPALAAFGASFDVFGDGSLLLLSTPGHSAGSMSLLVRGEGAAPVLLVGDVTYNPDLLAKGVVPDTGAREVQLETARKIVALEAALPGLVVLAAHDARVPERLAAVS